MGKRHVCCVLNEETGEHRFIGVLNGDMYESYCYVRNLVGLGHWISFVREGDVCQAIEWIDLAEVVSENRVIESSESDLVKL